MNKADVKGDLGAVVDKPGEKDVLTPANTYPAPDDKSKAPSVSSEKSVAALAVDKIIHDFESKLVADSKASEKASKPDPSKDKVQDVDHP